MNKKQQAGGGIQWGRMLKKLNPYDPEGLPLSEALWTEGILDPSP